MSGRAVNEALKAEVERFLYMEARLQDAHDYDGWESLWTDDALYWIPANGADTDPERQMSIIYDNRSRIAARTRQFHTGKRHTQSPVSNICHVISNIEADELENGEIGVRCNAIVFESNLSRESVWACRNELRLRRVEGQLKLAYKKVVLVNNDKPLYTLSFLI